MTLLARDRRRFELPASAFVVVVAADDRARIRRRSALGVGTRADARRQTRQRNHFDTAAQLCRAADRQLLHLRSMAKRRKRRLSAVASLCGGGAAAELRRHPHSPRILVRSSLSRDLRRGDDPHALGPRDASDRGQCRSEPAPRHSRFADRDRRDDAGGRNGGRGRDGRGFRDPGAAGRVFVAGLRLHWLSRRLARGWRRDRHRRDGVPVRSRQLCWRHPADHPGDALRRHQSPDGVGPVHCAWAAQSDGGAR